MTIVFLAAAAVAAAAPVSFVMHPKFAGDNSFYGCQVGRSKNIALSQQKPLPY